MSVVVGGCLAISGMGIGLDTVENVSREIRKNISGSKIDQIIKLTANVLSIVGKFLIGVELVTAGAFVWTAGPTIGTLTALSQALKDMFIPFVGASATLAGAEILRIITE